MSNRYRIKECDPFNDVYLLQKRVFWFWWFSVGAGTKCQIEYFIAKNDGLEGRNNDN